VLATGCALRFARRLARSVCHPALAVSTLRYALLVCSATFIVIACRGSTEVLVSAPGPVPFVLTTPLPTATSTPATVAATPVPQGLGKIDHFVFITEENRSFDSYFGTYPGVDGIPDGVCLYGPRHDHCVSPSHDPSDVNYDGPHDRNDALADINGGLMDGFLARAFGRGGLCTTIGHTCQPGQDPRDVMGWHDWRDIPNYWTYASQFSLQDHFFASSLGYTLPNRLFGLSGQSGRLTDSGHPTKPNFEFRSIVDSLDAAGVDWSYYVTTERALSPDDGHVEQAMFATRRLPTDFSYFNPLPAFAGVRSNSVRLAHLVDTASFYDAARSGRLPAVAWIAPSAELSEHPPHSIRLGMAYVTGLVNAIMEGPDWNSTAIFISYDEWGGFYDHVTPPTIDGEGLGLRLPSLVISPYVRAGYVDHRVYSSASWLRTIEDRFDLPSLTVRDANAAPMLDMFDFHQPPRPPVLLDATPQGSPYRGPR
jgi:phospholipase C